MPALLTFGDSNTNGVLPIRIEGERRRLGPADRWPGVALAALGEGWSLAEEGLPGRTTAHPDAEMGPHMDGRVGLMIALETHWPIDVMTLMLGTNDLKVQFDVTPERIAAGCRGAAGSVPVGRDAGTSRRFRGAADLPAADPGTGADRRPSSSAGG